MPENSGGVGGLGIGKQFSQILRKCGTSCLTGNMLGEAPFFLPDRKLQDFAKVSKKVCVCVCVCVYIYIYIYIYIWGGFSKIATATHTPKLFVDLDLFGVCQN